MAQQLKPLWTVVYTTYLLDRVNQYREIKYVLAWSEQDARVEFLKTFDEKYRSHVSEQVVIDRLLLNK